MKNTLSPYNNTSRVKSQYSPLSNRGFTIVELLVVIVVVAILAAIAIVSYNGITRSAEETALKSNLRSAATKVTLHKAQSGSYPGGLDEVGVAEESEITRLQYTGGTNTYCVTAFSTRDADLSFYIDQEGEIREGSCDGHISSSHESVIDWDSMIEHDIRFSGDIGSSGDFSLIILPTTNINRSVDQGATIEQVSGSFGANATKPAVSGDGSYVYYSRGTTPGIGIMRSSNGGQYFSPTSGAGTTNNTNNGRVFVDPVVCDDGSVVVSGRNNSGQHVIINDNYGIGSWTVINSIGSGVGGNMRGVGISGDCSTIVALWSGNVRRSTDAGFSWVDITPYPATNHNIAMSNDGSFMAVVPKNNTPAYIYTSTNSGSTWNERSGSGSRVWVDIDVSRNGEKIVAATAAAVYLSSDGGDTWQEDSSLDLGDLNIRAVSVSHDGSKVLVVASELNSPTRIYRGNW